jgi:hypothetical protein
MKDPLDVSSDPPARPFALSFEDEPATPPRPAREPVVRTGGSVFATLVSLLVDGICLAAAASAVAAAGLWREPYPFDAVVRHAPLWAALLVAIGVADSFAFVALLGRTPGMAATGREVRTIAGDVLTPLEAFVRAALSALSAPALFGFMLGVCTGQTLHDRLCGSRTVSR